MPRRRDEVKIEIVSTSGQRLTLDNFTSFEISADLTSPFEASFEIGNDGSWESIRQLVQPGTRYKVFVNNLARLSGKIQLNDIPLDAGAGSVVRFSVRSVLAEAQFTSARQRTRVKNTTLQDFVLDLYSPLGVTSVDFLDDQAAARDLLTGKRTTNQGTNGPKLERIKIEEARVKPPETIYAAADRHLRRHGLMHWDAGDGKIVVGAPNDTQDPIFKFYAFRDVGKAKFNNVLGITRTFDTSGVPTTLAVFGVGGKRSFSKSRVAAFAQNRDLIEQGFYRPVTILAEGIKNQELAERAANRELSARSKTKDMFEVEVDGLSYWDGSKQFPYGIDTVCSLDTDVAAGGPYYVHRVSMRRDSSTGDTTNLTMLRRGIWKL